MYRAALIGCGKIGSEYADDPLVESIYSHAEAYATCPDAELVAVCDIDPAKLESCGQRWNVAARYDDPLRLLLEQQPDIVSVCTPDNTHYDLVQQAIVTPGVLAILAEKPLALRLKQAEKLVHLAREREVMLVVNYTRRYANSHIHLRDSIQSGEIGSIQTVGGFYTMGTLHNGTHWFDLARFLVGEVCQVWGVDVRKEGGEDPTLDAYLEFECGAGGHLQGCDAKAFSLFEMDLIGTLGRVRIVESGYRFETYTAVDSPHFTGYRSLGRINGLQGGLHDATLHALEDLVQCLKTDGMPHCSGEDGVAALEIASAVVKSARCGRVVSLRGH